MTYILIFIVIGILIVFSVLILRVISFNPLEEKKTSKFDVELDDEKIVERFVEVIRCKTISYKDTSLEDEKELEKFRKLLMYRYPNVNSKCELQYR